MNDWKYWLTLELDKIGVRGRKKSCAVMPQEDGRHAVSKTSGAINMKIAIEDIARDATFRRRERG